MINDFILTCYKDAIKDAHKRLEPKMDYILNVCHTTFDSAIENAVCNYFTAIKCTFDREIFLEAKQAISKET